MAEALNPIQIIAPLTVTDSVLIASTVAETETAWANNVTYAAGDLRRVNHTIYESQQASNFNHDPTTDTAGTWWKRAYSTNRWRCFDSSYSSQTTGTSPLSLQLRPARTINALALLNLTGTAARVRVIDPTDGTVYDKTFDLVSPLRVSTFTAWFFSPVEYVRDVIITDLPPYSTADIYVDITGPSTVGVGVVLPGFLYDIGADIHQGARFGVLDYSKKGAVDKWGNTDLQSGGNAPWADTACVIELGNVDGVNNLIRSLLGIPFVFIGYAGVSSLSLYGTTQTYEMQARSDGRVLLTWRINGMA